MIRITKGAAPAVLNTRGVDEANKLRAAYVADRQAYDDGAKKLPIKRGLYAHRSVTAALGRCHHGKCAYCEVLILIPYAETDVEHWRPKKGVQQSRGERLQYPGYYWLAYDWDNLLLSCIFCNRRNKKNLFYLENPRSRARNHTANLGRERPATLRPDGRVDPRRHIRFVEELPTGLTPRGRSTIEMLGLDRIEHRARDTRMALLRDAVDLITRLYADPHPELQQMVADERAFLASAVLPTAPFSAMAIDYLATVDLP